MIDTTKAKADAEEGLRIARRATEAPWDVEHDIVRAVGRYSIGGFDETDDSLFAADSRTRAPDAYRNVIALAEENERLRAEVARCGKLELDHLRIDSRRLGDLIAMQEKVTALEDEVERWRSDAVEDVPSREVHRDIRAHLGLTQGQSTIVAVKRLAAEVARLEPLDAEQRHQRERDEAIEQGSR